MFGLFKKKDPITTFWSWFTANHARFQKFQENPDACLNEILAELLKVRRGLAVEFEPPKNGVIDMTISADGNRELFPTVLDLVQQAPPLPEWKFLAFRQRMDPARVKGMKIKVGDQELEPGNLKFLPVTMGNDLDVIIFADHVTEENYNAIAYGSLLLLDNLLGEFDCVTKVRKYDFQMMPADPDETRELMPLLELPAFIDQFHMSAGN